MPPATQPSAVATEGEDKTEQWLAKMFWEAVGDDDVDALTYKPAAVPESAGGKGKDGTNNKAASAAQTPPASPAPPAKSHSVMANGQDFWAELRKQVTALTDKEKQDKEKEGG